ncbi:MAG: hypothetical protein ACI85K_002316 [Hyphomicrobiaceae bacterium]
MRSHWVIGLGAVSLALLWWLTPSEVALPPELSKPIAPANDQASSPEQVAPERKLAVATGTLAVTRFGDGSCELKVEVTDAHGRPVSGASVTWQGYPWVAPFATVETDTRGLCTAKVWPGALFVRAYHPSIGKSILLRLSTEDQRLRVPRLALLRPVEVVGVVMDAQKRPVANAQLVVQALLGIPRGHAAECVTSELVQCDENGVFAFEASYGTRGTLRMAGDAEAAKSQSPFAAGLDEYVTVGPRGVSHVERANSNPKSLSTALGGQSRDQRSSQLTLPQGSKPTVDLKVMSSREVIPPSPNDTSIHVQLADGSGPTRLQVEKRVDRGHFSKLEWHGLSTGDRVRLKLPGVGRSDPWWFVTDPDSGQSAQLTDHAVRSAKLNLGPPGSLHVRVTYNGRATRGLNVMIEPCGTSQTARPRSDGMARFRVPAGSVKVRVLRGVEELATKTVVVTFGNRTEATLRVDLSK